MLPVCKVHAYRNEARRFFCLFCLVYVTLNILQLINFFLKVTIVEFVYHTSFKDWSRLFRIFLNWLNTCKLCRFAKCICVSGWSLKVCLFCAVQRGCSIYNCWVMAAVTTCYCYFSHYTATLIISLIDDFSFCSSVLYYKRSDIARHGNYELTILICC